MTTNYLLSVHVEFASAEEADAWPIPSVIQSAMYEHDYSIAIRMSERSDGRKDYRMVGLYTPEDPGCEAWAIRDALEETSAVSWHVAAFEVDDLLYGLPAVPAWREVR